jgi:hypothetical protein
LDSVTPWRDVVDQLRPFWLLLGAYRLGEGVHAVNVDLGDEIEAKAKTKTNAASWFRARALRYLKAALGRDVELLLVAEDGVEEGEKTGRLHFHGLLLVTEIEAKAARKALRLAAGEWDPRSRRHQVKTEPVPDVGFASYSAKCLALARPGRKPIPGSRKVTFLGRGISATKRPTDASINTYQKCSDLMVGKPVPAAAPVEDTSVLIEHSAGLAPATPKHFEMTPCPHPRRRRLSAPRYIRRVDQRGPRCFRLRSQMSSMQTFTKGRTSWATPPPACSMPSLAGIRVSGAGPP